jgi:hypothetical protein
MNRRLVIGCLAGLLSSAVSFADRAPPASQISIDSVAANGEGCPPGTAAGAVSPDGSAFTIGFSRFAVEVGSGAAYPSKAACHLHVKVTIPPGWSYAVAGIDYVGWVALDSGITASRQTTYHLSGESPQRTAAYNWPDGFVGDYDVNAISDGATLDWSRCGKGKNLMIDTQLSIDSAGNSTGNGYATVDAVDGEVYRLVWQQCK